MKILLVGEESAAVTTLKALSKTGHEIAYVMASPSDQESGMQSLWNFARKQGYATLPSILVKDPAFAKRVKEEEIDLLLNVHSLYLIDGHVVDAPRLGSFNLHPGPLPQYAGLHTVSWAIYQGETTYGVSLHEMVPKIDAGRIAYQESIEIAENDSAIGLYLKCVRLGVPLVVKLVEAAAQEPPAIPLYEQDMSKRKYTMVGRFQGKDCSRGKAPLVKSTISSELATTPPSRLPGVIHEHTGTEPKSPS